MKHNKEKTENSFAGLTDKTINILLGNFSSKRVASDLQVDEGQNQKMTPEERDIHIVHGWIP